MTLVSEAMDRAPATIGADAPASQASVVAREAGADHLLVVDEGALVGVLCGCDLDAVTPGEPVWERMTVPVLTVRPDASVEEAALTMSDCRVGCLPVVIGGLVMGIVTGDDLRRAGASVPEDRRRCHHHRAQRSLDHS